MLPFKHKKISGWGNFPTQSAQCFRPEKRSELHNILDQATNQATTPFITGGNGTSYGDAAVTSHTHISSLRLNRFIEFNIEKGLLKCESGVTLGEILDIVIPKGWFLPVIPGTKRATVGGAFACNVHGKNHYAHGEFAEHVTRIQLRLADNSTIVCTPSNHKDLFWATAGGMGMTGIIEEITLKLIPIESQSLKTASKRVANINDMLEQFKTHRDTSDYMIGWIDHSATKTHLGRGVFESAKHIAHHEGGTSLDERTDKKKPRNIPFFLPSFVLNKWTMRVYNALRFKNYSEEIHSHIIDFEGFFHPLDNLNNWNRLYGKRGFLQYQCILPEHDDVASHLHELLDIIQSEGLFSYLAVIKYHRNSKGLMSFSQQGYSLALDFPNTPAVRELIDRLNTYILSLGGSIYLAKDALLSAEQFSSMYEKNLEEWQSILHTHDPNNHITSGMAKRLAFKKEET